MGVWQGVCVLCVAQLSSRDEPERPDLLGMHEKLLLVQIRCVLSCHWYIQDCLFGGQLWARAFPSLKVNTFKMPALHDETSAAVQNVTPSLSLCLLLTSMYAHIYIHIHKRTLCLTLSLSCRCFCWRDNSVYRGGRLRQARIATYTEVWIYVSHREEYTWHGSGTLWQ